VKEFAGSSPRHIHLQRIASGPSFDCCFGNRSRHNCTQPDPKSSGEQQPKDKGRGRVQSDHPASQLVYATGRPSQKANQGRRLIGSVAMSKLPEIKFNLECGECAVKSTVQIVRKNRPPTNICNTFKEFSSAEEEEEVSVGVLSFEMVESRPTPNVVYVDE
jgi:hypothetical protein